MRDFRTKYQIFVCTRKVESNENTFLYCLKVYFQLYCTSFWDEYCYLTTFSKLQSMYCTVVYVQYSCLRRVQILPAKWKLPTGAERRGRKVAQMEIDSPRLEHYFWNWGRRRKLDTYSRNQKVQAPTSGQKSSRKLTKNCTTVHAWINWIYIK